MTFAGASAEVVAAAIDLGATSGRVVVGRIAADRLDLTEVARFANSPREVDGVWRWDLASLWREIGAGVRVAVLDHGATTVGIDSWAVDYGLLGADGRLLADPACYRDPRTESVLERAGGIVGRAEHYRITGLQYQPFNTIYQLLAEPASVLGAGAQRMLMLPDLLSYLMTGVQGAERNERLDDRPLRRRRGHVVYGVVRPAGDPIIAARAVGRTGVVRGPDPPRCAADMGNRRG